MAYTLKTTGVVAPYEILSAVVVNETGTGVVDLVGNAITTHANVTYGNVSWRGTTRPYFRPTGTGFTPQGVTWDSPPSAALTTTQGLWFLVIMDGYGSENYPNEQRRQIAVAMAGGSGGLYAQTGNTNLKFGSYSTNLYTSASANFGNAQAAYYFFGNPSQECGSRQRTAAGTFSAEHASTISAIMPSNGTLVRIGGGGDSWYQGRFFAVIVGRYDTTVPSTIPTEVDLNAIADDWFGSLIDVPPAPVFSGTLSGITGVVGLSLPAMSPTVASYFTGAGITYSASPTLPTGITLNASTGNPEGTPVSTEVWTGTITGSNGTPPNATTNSFTITINSPTPTVNTQPSSTTVQEPDPGVFTADFNNTPTSYAWEYADSPYSSWAAVIGGSGASTASYTTPATTAVVTGRRFRCTATNVTGSVTTNGAAQLTVTPIVAPSISTQPVDRSVTAPTTTTFTVVATGTPTPTYQWQRNSGGNTSFAAISGAVSASYTTPVTTVTGGTANHGDTYRCVISNSGGTVTSNIVTLSVTAPLDGEAPVMTGNLTESSITTSSYTLSWSAATDNMSVVGYQLTLNGGTTWFPIGNVLTYSVTGRTPGSTDSCRVRAYDLTPNYSNELTKSVTLQSTTMVTDPLENLSGSLYLSTTVNYSWFPGGRIGSLTGIPPVEGTATSHATTGILTIPNLSLGSGVLLTCVRNSDASTDGIHYQALTVTAV